MKKRIANYLEYNQERKNKAAAFDQNKASLLFRIVPYLLHNNHPELPGFVDNEACPYGIHLFKPEEAVSFELFIHFFPTCKAFNQIRDSEKKSDPCIHSLKTIGSIGSIAQTEISDCDYWISIRRDEIDATDIELLEQKCRDIEEWSMKKGTEIHFFLMDIDETREDRFESAAEDESAGSSLKLLLKDELFRTHILVAGKMLLWWLIPPRLSNQGYLAFAKKLVESKNINKDHFIDLGYLNVVPKEEIFGACLWQMNKALDSPFKSVIKFAYLELLFQDRKQSVQLFSDKIKYLVTFNDNQPAGQEETLPLADVDPYLLLAREIVQFYANDESSDKKQDNLIKQCLFLKTIEGLQSQKNKQVMGGRNTKLMKLMDNWQLLPNDPSHFLLFHNWHHKELVQFGIQIHDYLIETYKRLRLIFKTLDSETSVTITERDIAILGRKLFTFYKNKPNKIEYIRSISPDLMCRDDVTFHATNYSGVDYYYAFQGALDFDDNTIKNHTAAIIRRENDPVTLMTWLMVNSIIDNKTRLHLTKTFMPLSLVDLQQLSDAMLDFFPRIHFAHISAEHLLKKERIERAFIVVNMAKLPVRGSKSLLSSLVTRNSYGEYFIEHFITHSQLKNAMRSLLSKHFVSRWNHNLLTFVPVQPESGTINTM
ncbi:MAG: class I adenylate cyclase, partial [Desulfobulbaceae bacterium]|nr:class I adenylate cyclase [Desulfobulbaceae bacterium]